MIRSTRCLSLALLFVLASPRAEAQATLWPSGLAITAPQEAKAHDLRILHNAKVCANAALDAGCSQAEVDAVGKDGTIYAATTAGLQAFLVGQILRPFVMDKLLYGDEATAVTHAKLSKARRDAICADFGRSSGCTVIVR